MDEAWANEQHRIVTPGNPLKVQRRLAAILAADVVGFSRLMEQDETGTLARIKSLRSEVIEPHVAEHGGRVFKTTGDGFLVEFPSPVEAVECAVDIQKALSAIDAQVPSRGLHLRIGINLGDIIIEPDGNIYGDGVNVAARLKSLADPGGILISGKVFEEVRDKLSCDFRDWGEQIIKNIAKPVKAYSFISSPPPTLTKATLAPLTSSDKPSIAILPSATLAVIPIRTISPKG